MHIHGNSNDMVESYSNIHILLAQFFCCGCCCYLWGEGEKLRRRKTEKNVHFTQLCSHPLPHYSHSKVIILVVAVKISVAPNPKTNFHLPFPFLPERFLILKCKRCCFMELHWKVVSIHMWAPVPSITIDYRTILCVANDDLCETTLN